MEQMHFMRTLHWQPRYQAGLGPCVHGASHAGYRAVDKARWGSRFSVGLPVISCAASVLAPCAGAAPQLGPPRAVSSAVHWLPAVAVPAPMQATAPVAMQQHRGSTQAMFHRPGARYADAFPQYASMYRDRWAESAPRATGNAHARCGCAARRDAWPRARARRTARGIRLIVGATVSRPACPRGTVRPGRFRAAGWQPV